MEYILHDKRQVPSKHYCKMKKPINTHGISLQETLNFVAAIKVRLCTPSSLKLNYTSNES